MAMEIDPKHASLTIGESFTDNNKLRFTIKLNGNDKGKVKLTLQMPVGIDGIIQQPADATIIEVSTPGIKPAPFLLPYDPEKPVREWQLGSKQGISGSQVVQVSINKVPCRTSTKKSVLKIIATVGDEFARIERDIEITKSKPAEPPANPILYFTATPRFLNGPGNVELRWELADNKNRHVILNSDKRHHYEDPPCPWPSPEKLAEDTTFYLEASCETQSGGRKGTRSLHIPVYRAGWHDVYPPENSFFSVLFDSNGSYERALYAIIVRNNTSVLYRSSNGLAQWEPITAGGVQLNVPRRMESSPGLLFHDRLLLIGGSAVDPDNKSNSIWYIELDKDGVKGKWEKASVVPEEFPMRMGHACVIVSADEFWVLGGIDEFGRPLNDVWSFRINDQTKDGEKLTLNSKREWAASRNKDRWTARCMFSAVNFENDIWVCGGVDEPANGKFAGDLWRCGESKKEDGKTEKTWEARRLKQGDRYVTADAIGTGAAVDQEGQLTIAVVNSKGIGQVKHAIKIWQRDNSYSGSDHWNDILTPRKPSWTAHPHSISMVAFQGRLYLRYLHRSLLRPGNKEEKPALQVCAGKLEKKNN
jgi:hypothetical protein